MKTLYFGNTPIAVIQNDIITLLHTDAYFYDLADAAKETQPNNPVPISDGKKDLAHKPPK